jgi:hypothetical protein
VDTSSFWHYIFRLDKEPFGERNGNVMFYGDPKDISITIATTGAMVSFLEGQKL